MRKAGNNKHSKDWIKVWPKLKRRFKKAGIIYCEGRFTEKCWIDNGLTPAHTLKRRHITTEIEEIALLCIPCHDFAELQGEAKMKVLIRSVIAKREVQP